MDRIVETLPNGLRAVCARTDGTAMYAGVLVNAGSRDDFDGRDGLAHFVEHTLFKGTRRRKAWQLSNRMETVGGDLNAYTTKENIMIYSEAPAGFEERTLELMADMVENATFPDAEIDLERGVILEEIHTYGDNPAYAVFDDFEELFFKDSRLAHNILGYKDSVQAISGADARGFVEHCFTPGQMVVYCSSPCDPAKSMRMVRKYFGGLNRPDHRRDRPAPPSLEPFDELRNNGNRQANTILGARVFGIGDPRRYAMFMLSNLLGGSSMNSRLNRELRDKRGLVYSVEANVSFFHGAGEFQIYFGTDPENVSKCTRIVNREIDKLAQSPIPERSFRAISRQMCGQLLVDSNNRSRCAMSMAKTLLTFGEVIDTARTAQLLSQVTPEDLCEAARLVAAEKLSRLTLI